MAKPIVQQPRPMPCHVRRAVHKQQGTCRSGHSSLRVQPFFSLKAERACEHATWLSSFKSHPSKIIRRLALFKERVNSSATAGKDLIMAENEIVVEEESEEVTPSFSSSLNVEDDDEAKLKHLGFVNTAAIYFAVCLSTLYELAKDNAGPLKHGVDNIEATVQTVLSPLYEKFHDVPSKLLVFVDRKVDDVFFHVETYVPSLVKQASSQALTVATEVQRAGVLGTTKSIARSVRYKYEPVAEYYAATVWRLLNRVPLFPEVAELVIPTAFYWSEKYNDAVRYVGDRDYYVAEYLPMIPIEKISDILEQEQCRAD